MLFAINSACSSPEYITLEDIDFDFAFDFDAMSRKSSSSPGNERNGSVPPLPPTMNETLFSTHEHGSPYSDERSSLGAVHSYLHEDRITIKSELETTRSHFQVAPSFNFPVNPESTLITPTSLSSVSPSISHRALAVRPRSETPVQHYSSYNNNLYPNTSNPQRTSAHEENAYSSYQFYENEPPPQPYWGSYNVSAPAPPSSPPRNNSRQVLIAPHPSRSSSTSKRQLDDDMYIESRSRKRPSLTRETYPVERKQQELNQEEQVLVHLKEDLKLPWKDITARWSHEIGRPKNEAALQMQYKRLKERIRVWTDGDLRALTKAVQQVDSMRWEVISQTMLDFGVREKWTRQACQAKWESMDEQEMEMAKTLAGCSPSHSYDDRYSSRGGTPDVGLGVSPSQLLISQGHHDGLPSYNDQYLMQHDWSYVPQGV